MPRRQTKITGKLLNEVWNVGAKHALYREDGKWYHNLVDFPGVLFDANGYVLFETEEEYIKSPYLRITEDLHITEGISFIPEYIRVSEQNQLKNFSRALKDTIGEYHTSPAEALSQETPSQHEILQAFDLPTGRKDLRRVLRQINRIVRDTLIARSVKIVHNYRCQICGYTLDLGSGKLYAESHHIKPLGAKHSGPDTVENIMCVCPNHHALLDYGAIPINIKALRVTTGHIFNEQYIEYHNSYLYKRGNGSIVAPRD